MVCVFAVTSEWVPGVFGYWVWLIELIIRWDDDLAAAMGIRRGWPSLLDCITGLESRRTIGSHIYMLDWLCYPSLG
jgi:hypothetical protein